MLRVKIKINFINKKNSLKKLMLILNFFFFFLNLINIKF
jgi:hypothetical protein